MSEYDDGGYIASSPRREFTAQKNIRSFTIKTLLNTDIENKPYKIDDSEISQISLVGWVKSTKQTKAGHFFVLDDKTGTIGCTYWPKSVYEEQLGGLLEEKNLLNVAGTLRVYEGKVHITANFIKVINDANFVTYHYIKCIYQHLFYNNKLKRSEISEKRKSVQIVDNENLGEDRAIGFTKIQSEILDVYRKNQEDTGLHVDVVVRMLCTKYKESEIRENIEILLSDCHLYTVDGLEYKTTL